jgi:peptidoglycan/LPS O-acetylase OafA/YrhL
MNQMQMSTDKLIIYLSRYRSMIMGLSILSILLFHQHWFEGGYLWKFFHYWGHFGVDVFFFVSGFGIYYSIQKNTILRYYENRIIRLLPVCLLCGIIRFVFCKSYEQFECSYAMFLSLDLWFIQSIILFYTIAPLLYKLVNSFKIDCYFFFVVLCLCGIFYRGESFVFFSCARFPVFLMGMLVSSGNIIITKRTFLLSFSCFLFAIIYRYFWRTGFFEGNLQAELLTYIVLSFGIIAFIYGLILLCVFLGKIKFNVPFVYLGKFSLEIYLWNEFVYNTISFYYVNMYSNMFLFGGSLLIILILAISSHSVARSCSRWINNYI